MHPQYGGLLMIFINSLNKLSYIDAFQEIHTVIEKLRSS